MQSIEELKRELKKYKVYAYYDVLTGLCNRRKFKKDLKRFLSEKDRFNHIFYIAMIDIDNFKSINDKYGHKYGDKILKQTAKCLKEFVRASDRVYRYGGDEFVIVFSVKKKTKNFKFIKRLKEKMKKKNINISLGYSELSNRIMNIIDKNMYRDKRRQ